MARNDCEYVTYCRKVDDFSSMILNKIIVKGHPTAENTYGSLYSTNISNIIYIYFFFIHRGLNYGHFFMLYGLFMYIYMSMEEIYFIMFESNVRNKMHFSLNVGYLPILVDVKKY